MILLTPRLLHSHPLPSYPSYPNNERPNQALHRTLANVANFRDDHRVFHVAEHILGLMKRR
jgi:hypothetical protein